MPLAHYPLVPCVRTSLCSKPPPGVAVKEYKPAQAVLSYQSIEHALQKPWSAYSRHSCALVFALQGTRPALCASVLCARRLLAHPAVIYGFEEKAGRRVVAEDAEELCAFKREILTAQGKEESFLADEQLRCVRCLRARAQPSHEQCVQRDGRVRGRGL